MTQLFNDVKITGVADVPQLTILANATQVTNPIQVWQDSAGNPLLRVSGDGRLQIGNNIALGSADALINANYNPSGAQPTSAWHAAGVLNIPTSLAGTVNWVYHELQLTGTGTVNGVQSGLYTKLTNSTTGNAGSADVRAATFQAISSGGGTALPVGKATGMRAIASNAVTGGSAYLNQAIGVEATISNDVGGSITAATAFSVAAPNNGGTIGTLYGLKMPDLTQGSANYALYTGKGIVHIGDVLETPVLASTPTSTPPTNFVQLYTKLLAGAPQLYAKNSSGTEYLVGGGGGGAPTTSKYLLQVADGSLPNAQAMGALSTGLVKNTTTTGVQSIATAGTDYTSPTGTENLSNKTISASTLDNSVIGSTTPAAITGTTIKANGILTASSGQVIAERVVTVAGTVTVATTDYMVTVNKTTGASTTVNLPASPTTGQTFVIHDGKGDAATNNITITPAAGNINGTGTLVLNINYASAIVTYNGTQWDAQISVTNISITNPTGTISPPLWLIASTDNVQLLVKGNSTQTNDLQEWQNSSGTLLANLRPSGSLYVFGQTDDIHLFAKASPIQTNPLFELQANNGYPALVVGGTGATTIFGQADNVQLTVQGWATQTNNLQEWKTLGSTVVASLDNNGLLTTKSLKVTTGVASFPHLSGNGSSPTIANNNSTGAAISGTDVAGKITFNPSAGATANSTAVTITFNTAFAAAPSAIILTPANANVASLAVNTVPFVASTNITTTGFSIVFAGLVPSSSLQLQFYYAVLG